MHVIGTAGHIDHGKSTLVRALTGIDPDRLAEEKRRGMTIELGFAWLRLPSGREASVVDVPGHERFIRHMLAGAGGVDVALLVVAADEGVMPQTREHLDVLDLLGVAVGVVALTKCDLVVSNTKVVGADGAELICRLRKEHPDIPFLYIANIGRSTPALEARLPADIAIIREPFTAQQLRAAVDEEVFCGDL